MQLNLIACAITLFISIGCIAADKSDEMVHVFVRAKQKKASQTAPLYVGHEICEEACGWLSKIASKSIPDLLIFPCACPFPSCKKKHSMIIFGSEGYSDYLMALMKKWGAVGSNPHQTKEIDLELLAQMGK